MYLKRLISRQTLFNFSRINGGLARFNALPRLSTCESKPTLNPPSPKPSFRREFHSSRSIQSSFAEAETRLDSEEDDGAMNEFLSRFVWIMRGKILESYPDFDKRTIDEMLQIIVEKVVSEMENEVTETILDPAMASKSPPEGFSEDLWEIIWEVSNEVLNDMKKAAKKEKMKKYLQCDEVKKMTRFAMEAGVRGEMLRELRYKWACEKMEEAEFHQGLESLKERDEAERRGDYTECEEEGESREVSLPKRRGKIRYKIYGLDLSKAKWAEVAEKVNEAGEIVWPEEVKPMTGKCKIVYEKIMSFNEDDDPAPLLAEWAELVEPNRADWIALLDGLKHKNTRLYLKVAELLLSEKSLEANVRDYSNLIDAYAKENRVEDAERIIQKMNENGIVADLLTANSLVHMYSKSGNLDRAKEAFESLKTHGFQPNSKLCNSMVMAYVNAGRPKEGWDLLKQLRGGDIKLTMEMYMTLLRAFARIGDAKSASMMSNCLDLSRSLESFSLPESFEHHKLMVEANVKAGIPDVARKYFDDMLEAGHMPDDECTANMISAYKKKNQLDYALPLLLQLEKNGFQPGVVTYTVLVDWLGRLQLIEEAEQVLGKISELGEAPSYKLQISLLDMYSRARIENKTLKILGVLESKKDELESDEFERIINSLIAGKFTKQAQRMVELMRSRGFTVSEDVMVALKSLLMFSRWSPLQR